MKIVGRKLDWKCAVCALFIGVGHLTFLASAHASCGDYVMIGGHGGHSHAAAHEGSLDVMARAGQLPRLPCHGPECSQRSAPPAPHPVPVVSTTVQDWGWSAPSCLVAPPRLIRTVLTYPSCHELLHPGSIFRPPRSIV